MAKNPLGIDLGAIGDAMKDLENVYADGLGAMNKAGEQAAKDMKPSHRIKIDVNLAARVESHDYKVAAELEFLAELNSILNAETGDIAALLGGLDVDLDEKEKNQVAEQLGQPRCIAILDKSKVKELELSSDKGKIKDGINKKATMLITLDGNKLRLSFESVFALPELQTKQTLYYAIPSQEEMQKNVVIDVKKLKEKASFKWQEKDKDNLKIEGTVKIETLK